MLSIKNNSNSITLLNEPFIMIILGMILLNIYNYNIFFCYLLIPIFILIFRMNIKLFDFNILFIFLFSSLYFITLFLNKNNPESESSLIGYLLFPAIFYFFGKYIVSKYPTVTTIYYLAFFICFMFSILPFAANILSVTKIGFMQDRDLHMFWTDEEARQNATGIGSYFAINMAMLPLLFTQKVNEVEKKLGYFAFFLFGIGMFSTLNMSNRTGLFISIVAILFFAFIPKWNSIKSLSVISIFLVLIAFLYFTDTMNIRSWFEYSLYFERLSNTGIIDEGSRILIWKSNIIRLFNNPYGYSNAFDFQIYAHNLWLDVGRVAGSIPLIPLVVFTISAILNIYKVVTFNKDDIFFRQLILGMGIAFFITFFMEPVMEGLFIMFLFFCFYFGTVVGIKKYMLK